ncbi:MAG: YceI family protein [Pseudomonadota bacterium]
MKILSGLALAATLILGTPALAGGHIVWKSVDNESQIAFGSIKSNETGEVHHFNKVSGVVKEKGEMALTIELGSVETYIDIRNERMTEHVLKGDKPTATITGTIDMEEVNGLKPGETKLLEIEAQLSFAGIDNDIDANMLVARLSEDRVLVTTADFIMVSTEDLGINSGIDTLMKLAQLPSITRVTPVSVRMVFEK